MLCAAPNGDIDHSKVFCIKHKKLLSRRSAAKHFSSHMLHPELGAEEVAQWLCVKDATTEKNSGFGGWRTMVALKNRDQETQLHQLPAGENDVGVNEAGAGATMGRQWGAMPAVGDSRPEDGGAGWCHINDDEGHLWFTNGIVWHRLMAAMPAPCAILEPLAHDVIEPAPASKEWRRDQDIYGNDCWTDERQWVLADRDTEEDDLQLVAYGPGARPSPLPGAGNTKSMSIQIEPHAQTWTDDLPALRAHAGEWPLELYEDLQLGGFIEHMKGNWMQDAVAKRNAHGIEMLYSCFVIRGVYDHIAFSILLHETKLLYELMDLPLMQPQRPWTETITEALFQFLIWLECECSKQHVGGRKQDSKYVGKVLKLLSRWGATDSEEDSEVGSNSSDHLAPDDTDSAGAWPDAQYDCHQDATQTFEIGVPIDADDSHDDQGDLLDRIGNGLVEAGVVMAPSRPSMMPGQQSDTPPAGSGDSCSKSHRLVKPTPMSIVRESAEPVQPYRTSLKTIKTAILKSRKKKANLPLSARKWIMEQFEAISDDQHCIPPVERLDDIVQEGIRLGELAPSHNLENIRTAVWGLFEQRCKDAD
jgi:hypothetical protein